MDKAVRRVKAVADKVMIRHIKSMKKAPDKADDERAARLAQALRANLHRRKAQAREAENARPDPARDD